MNHEGTVYTVTIAVGDLGFPAPEIGLNRVLAQLERGGLPRPAVRGLRDLASSNLDKFVQVISTRDSLCAWARAHPDDSASPLHGKRRYLGTALIQFARAFHGLARMAIQDRAAFRAFVRSSDSLRAFFQARGVDGLTSWPLSADWRTRRTLNAYIKTVRRLGRFGAVSIAIPSADATFSPYYTLGRDQPLSLSVPLETPGDPITAQVKLFSSGLVSVSALARAGTMHTPSPQMAAAVESLKALLPRITDGVSRGARRPPRGFASYYSDRFVLTIKHSMDTQGSLRPATDDATTDDSLVMTDLGEWSATLYCSALAPRASVAAYLCELVLLQRFFAVTRDAYIDKCMREFSARASLQAIEKHLDDFLQISTSVRFSEDEGGDYKLFSDGNCLLLYRQIREALRIPAMADRLDKKVERFMTLLSLASFAKRDRAMLYTGVVAMILALAVAVDLLVRAIRALAL